MVAEAVGHAFDSRHRGSTASETASQIRPRSLSVDIDLTRLSACPTCGVPLADGSPVVGEAREGNVEKLQRKRRGAPSPDAKKSPARDPPTPTLSPVSPISPRNAECRHPAFSGRVFDRYNWAC